jgi:hypothetical protein
MCYVAALEVWFQLGLSIWYYGDYQNTLQCIYEKRLD